MQTKALTLTDTTTHARHVASKVAADLKRVQRIYQIESPPDSEIAEYQKEIAILLDHGYLDTVTYGFKRRDKWVIALKYRSTNGNLDGDNDDPGGIKPEADIDISGTYFTSFLSYSKSWFTLSLEQQKEFKKSLPIKRVKGLEPDIEGGSWGDGNRYYQSGELGVQRSMIRRL